MNPYYECELRPDPTDEKQLSPQADKRLTVFGRLLSFVVTVLCCIFVLVCTYLIHLLAIALRTRDFVLIGWLRLSHLASSGLSLQIIVWDKVWGFIATRLARMEQHPTLQEYNDAISNKKFYMCAFITFSPFMYVYFTEKADEDHWHTSLCWMYPMYYIGEIVEMTLPRLRRLFGKGWREGLRTLFRGEGRSQEDWDETLCRHFEKEWKMELYTGSADDYIEVIFPWASS